MAQSLLSPAGHSAPPAGGEVRSGDATYHAFISYSHAADATWAPLLQSALQRFAKPWYRRRALRVFRDEANLSATSRLTTSIQRALAASEHFILLASEEAARSEWVGRELEYWREHKGGNRNLLIAVTDGDIVWDNDAGDFDWTRTTALPREFSGLFTEEPRWVDLRFVRTVPEPSLRRHPAFRNAVADLAAPLHGKPKDDLVGEDIRQHRRVVRLSFAAAALIMVVAMIATILAVVAVRAKRIATSRYLAGQADAVLDTDPRLSMLLSVAASRRGTSDEKRRTLLEQVTHRRGLSGILDHRTEILDVAFSPDGKLIASAGRDGTVRLWDAFGGGAAPPRTLPQHTGPVVTVAFDTYEGATLASADQKGDVRVWDTSRGTLMAELSGSGRHVAGLAFDRAGRALTVVDREGEVSSWRMRGRAHSMAYLGPVTAVAFAPGGQTLAASTPDGTLRLWHDLHGGRPTQLATGLGAAAPLTFGRDGSLAAAGRDGSVLVWRFRSGRRPEQLVGRGHQGQVLDVAFSPDGRTLASAGQDGQVAFWEVRSLERRPVVGAGGVGEEPPTLVKAHAGRVSRVAFSPDGRRLVSAGADGVVRLWDVAGRRVFPAPLIGTPDQVRGVAFGFSPNGRLLASAGFDNTVWLWNMDRRTRTPLIGHVGQVFAVAFGPDGRTVASGGADGYVRFWDVPERVGEREFSLRAHRGRVLSVAFSPDGRTLASTGGEDGTVKLWDVTTRQIHASLRVPGGAGPVSAVAFSPDRHTLAVTFGNAVQLWDVSRREALVRLTGHAGFVYGVAFSRDGRTLASAGADKTVRLWDVASRAEVAELRGHGDSVFGVAFSPDGRTLASASADKTVRLWNVARRSVFATLNGHLGPVNGVAFRGDGRVLASAAGDERVLLWDVPRVGLVTHAASVRGFTLSSDGGMLALAGADGSIGLWDPERGTEVGTLRGHRGEVSAVAFSPTRRVLAAGGEDGTVRLWEPVDGGRSEFRSAVLPSPGDRATVNAVAFSPKGNVLASANQDGKVVLWELAAGKEPKEYAVHRTPLRSVAFSRDGHTLAWASRDGSIGYWDVRRHKGIRSFPAHTAPVNDVAFTRDGKVLASASADGTVGLWSVPSGTLRASLSGHTGEVTSVAFSRDGSILASVSQGKVMLYNTRNGVSFGKLITKLTGFNAGVDVAFSPKGTRLLLSANTDGTVVMSDLGVGSLQEQLCGNVRDDLTADERDNYLAEDRRRAVCDDR